MKYLPRLVAVLFSILGVAFNGEAQVSVTARMDSVNLLMGNVTTLYLQVVSGEKERGGLPLFENSRGDYVGVCGDSVELGRNFRVDTTYIGSGRMQLDYQITMQAFDSGTYRLPEFIYVAGRDSAYSNQLTFNVVPVDVTAETPISGFATVSEPENPRFYDFVPDWILDFWWIFIIIVLALAASYYALRRYKTVGTVLPVPKELTPYERAMRDLKNLKERSLWEKGMEKEYFTELTDILRNYLMNRFGINALEMTTRQIMEKINESEFRDKKSYIDDILSIADFVKFAKVKPMPEDNISSFNKAVAFVEETGFDPEPEKESDEEPDEDEGDTENEQEQ